MTLKTWDLVTKRKANGFRGGVEKLMCRRKNLKINLKAGLSRTRFST